MLRRGRFHAIFFVLGLLGVFVLHDYWVRNTAPQAIGYSEFQQYLREGKVERVVVSSHGIEGELTGVEGVTHFATIVVEPALAGALDAHGVEYSVEVDSSSWGALLSWVIPAVIFAALWVFSAIMLRRVGRGGGLLSSGTSNATVHVENDTPVAVRGVDEAKHELAKSVALVKDPVS